MQEESFLAVIATAGALIIFVLGLLAQQANN